MRPPASRGWVSKLLSLVAAAALVAGCSTPGGMARKPPVTPLPGGEMSVGSTTGLEAARVEAGIADCPGGKAAAATDNGLPEVTLSCLGGANSVTMSGLRGPLIINVWAQWCGPCRQEAPILAEVSAQAGENLAFMGVIYNDPRPDYALEFAQAAGWRYPQVLDPEKSLQAPLKIAGPPTSLFIDGDGRIAYRHIGPFTSAEQLRQLTAEHLGVEL